MIRPKRLTAALWRCLAVSMLSVSPLVSDMAVASDADVLDVLLKNGIINKDQYSALMKKGAGTVSPELLDVLQKNGAITKDQYGKLAKPAAAPATATAKADAKPPAKDAAHVRLGEKGLEFESDDGNYKFKIGGRIQVDTQVSFNQSGIPQQAELANGAGFRRLRLYTEGVMWKDYEYRFEYDWARNGGGVNGITDAYLKWIHFKPFALTIGQMSEGKSMESVMSNNYLTFIERSLPNNAFLEAGPNSKYQVGIIGETFDTSWDMPWTVRGGLTTESVGAPAPGNSSGNTASGNTQRNDLSGNTSYQLVGRTTIAPLRTKDGTLVHTGAWGSWRSVNNNFNPDGSVRTGGWAYQGQPDTDIDRTSFVNTGNLTTAKTVVNPRQANDIAMFGAELAGAYGPVHLATEYMRAQVTGPGYGSGNVLDGFYVQGGWFLTGETRPYDEKKGTWNRLTPFQNFTVGENGWGWGAWELAYRYDLVDLNTRNVSGGSTTAGTLGINWYLTPRVRFMTDWVHVFATNNGTAGKCTYPANGSNAPIACFNGVTPNIWEAAVRVDF